MLAKLEVVLTTTLIHRLICLHGFSYHYKYKVITVIFSQDSFVSHFDVLHRKVSSTISHGCYHNRLLIIITFGRKICFGKEKLLEKCDLVELTCLGGSSYSPFLCRRRSLWLLTQDVLIWLHCSVIIFI